MQGFKEHLHEESLNEELTVARLQKMYSDFNKKYFGNELPPIPMKFAPLKKIFADVRFTFRDGVVQKLNMRVSSTLRLNTETLIKIMLHEMVHIALINQGIFFTKGDKTGHGLEFQQLKKKIAQKSGVDIPDTERAAELEIFNPKPKKIFVAILDIGTKQFAAFHTLKSMELITRIAKEVEQGNPDMDEAALLDIFKKRLSSLKKSNQGRDMRVGIVNSPLWQKYTLFNKRYDFNKGFSLRRINKDEYDSLKSEIDKNIDSSRLIIG